MGARRLECTQGEWVRRQLLAGRSLAYPDLIVACGGRGGWRLGAVIRKLRQDGWPVRSIPIAGGCQANPPVRYSIPAGWNPGGGGPVQLGLQI